MLRLRALSLLLAPLLVALSAPLPTRAQDRYSRFEVGAQYSTIREDNFNYQGENFSGFGGRFDWNFTRRVAFESQVDFFPEHGVPLPLVQGGQTLQAVFGIRAKVIQTRQISVFGLVRPGLLHFTDALFTTSDPSNPLVTHPATYFVLNLGGGIEYYPSPRWILRFDIEGNPYRAPSTFNPSDPVPAPLGKINDTTRMSFGVGYRLGTLVDNERETNIPGQLGIWSALQHADGCAPGQLQESAGAGRGAFRGSAVMPRIASTARGLSRWRPALFPDYHAVIRAGHGMAARSCRALLVGTEGRHSPQSGSASSARSGRDSTVTRRRSRPRHDEGAPPLTPSRAPPTFVLDLGGIVEFYPGERSTLRMEVGDTHMFFSAYAVN